MWDILKPIARCISSTDSQIIIKYYMSDLKTVKPNVLGGINKYFHNTVVLKTKEEMKRKAITLFDAAKNHKKEKSTFLNVIYTYVNEEQRKTGHVPFVYAAMRYMDEFGVNEDLDVYKEILNTMPKGRYVATTLLKAEFMHYPSEQQCIIDLLEKMENNGVIPDPEIEEMVINICGKYSYPLRKLRRTAYWSIKFKNTNPWPMPRPLPIDPLELAKLAIRKIASVDVQSVITIFDTKDVKDSIDKTWIVSASSPDQERLISQHPKNIAAYVEGPYRIWISKASVDYFILHADVIQPCHEENIDLDDVSNLDISLWKKARRALMHHRSIHEQDNQTIFGICATGTSSKDSLLSWIRCLQPKNPALISIPILFKFIGVVNDTKRIGTGELIPETSSKVCQDETVKKIDK